MKTNLNTLFFIIGLMSFTTISAPSIYEFSIKDIDGEMLKLSNYKGKIIVVVNVASQSPLTEQFASLQDFHLKYESKGVVVIGCPSNSYRNELDTDKDIRSFCRSKYKITFPLSTKLEVKGSNQHPLFAYFAKKYLNEVMDAPVNFDFQKFIIGKDGRLGNRK